MSALVASMFSALAIASSSSVDLTRRSASFGNSSRIDSSVRSCCSRYLSHGQGRPAVRANLLLLRPGSRFHARPDGRKREIRARPRCFHRQRFARCAARDRISPTLRGARACRRAARQRHRLPVEALGERVVEWRKLRALTSCTVTVKTRLAPRVPLGSSRPGNSTSRLRFAGASCRRSARRTPG
jgi:hypothetical protein